MRQSFCFSTRRVSLLVVVGLIALGCGRDFASRAGQPTRLDARKLIEGDDKILNPSSIAVAGNLLAIGDDDDKMLKVFDRRSGRRVASLGPRGSGPGEFRSVWSLQGRHEDDSVVFWGFDTNLNRLVGYEMDESGAQREALPVLTPRIPGIALSLQWINDSTLVAAGTLEQGRLWLVSPSGAPMRPLGTVPLATPEFPLLAAQQALQPTIAIQPAGARVAVASRFAARVDIYDTKSSLMIPAAVPVPFEPELEVGSNGQIPVFRSNEQTRFGYISVTATRDRVFALFSGRTRAAYPGRANYGEHVHIFDWDGQFLGSLDLGHDTFVIAVDADANRLYGVSIDPEPSVYEYSLPSPTDVAP